MMILKVKKKEEAEPNNDNLVKDETIKQLYNQVAIYKEQSNRDKEQINTLNRLLENQQILALESNKKIQKLENQLEEERQLNYSFDISSNDRQNVNAQEATFTEESKDNNQQQEENQTTDKDIDPKVIFEENRNEDINQSTNAKENERVEKQDPNTNDEIERPSKKGFWSRLFGN